jgi:hypothetical protein
MSWPTTASRCSISFGCAELAAALPAGRYVQVPGNHFTALLSPELQAAILAFLASAPRG